MYALAKATADNGQGTGAGGVVVLLLCAALALWFGGQRLRRLGELRKAGKSTVVSAAIGWVLVIVGVICLLAIFNG